jgi:hypothetical protein
MKTSYKLLLGLFCLILISLVVINIIIKTVISRELTEQEKLTIINSTSDKSLFISSSEVFFSINKNTSMSDLNDYKSKLKEVNIDLNIKKIEYDKDNKIKLIEYTVNGKDGFGTLSRSSFENGFISYFYENDKVFFYYNYGRTIKSGGIFEYYFAKDVQSPQEFYQRKQKKYHRIR